MNHAHDFDWEMPLCTTPNGNRIPYRSMLDTNGAESSHPSKTCELVPTVRHEEEHSLLLCCGVYTVGTYRYVPTKYTSRETGRQTDDTQSRSDSSRPAAESDAARPARLS